MTLNCHSPNYGSFTKTPKPHWSDTPITKLISDALDVHVFIDTDVNAAALAESLWGAGVGHDVVAYVTVGTGVGGEDVTAFAMRPRQRGEVTVVDEIVH